MGERRVHKVDKRRGGGQGNAIAELRIRDEEDDDDDEEEEEEQQQREGKLMDLIWGEYYLGGGAKTREEY